MTEWYRLPVMLLAGWIGVATAMLPGIVLLLLVRSHGWDTSPASGKMIQGFGCSSLWGIMAAAAGCVLGSLPAVALAAVGMTIGERFKGKRGAVIGAAVGGFLGGLVIAAVVFSWIDPFLEEYFALWLEQLP